MEEYTLIYDYTPLINLEDNSYPVYFPDVRRRYSNTGFPYPIRDYVMETYGYAMVYDVAPPEGDVVTEVTPVRAEDGKFYRTYSIREFTPEERARDLQEKKFYLTQALFFVLDTDRNHGLSANFKGVDYVLTLTPHDISATLAVKDQASRANSGATYFIHTKDGAVGPLSPEEAIEFSNFVLDTFLALYENYAKAMKMTQEATRVSELPPIPDTFVPVMTS